MDTKLEELVRRRAKGLREYCHAPQAFYADRFQFDHIIAQQHGGETWEGNIAFCCLECNQRKGTNLSSIDPESGQKADLFNPRSDRWNDHFAWRGATIVGLTPVGRATAFLLSVNRPPRVIVRETLIEEGVFPPAGDRRLDAEP
jgi:hypothetical protein